MIFGKKEAPENVPELISEEIQGKSDNSSTAVVQTPKPVVQYEVDKKEEVKEKSFYESRDVDKEMNKEKELPPMPSPKKEESEEKKEEVKESEGVKKEEEKVQESKESESDAPKKLVMKGEKSFFEELEQEISKGLENSVELEKLTSKDLSSREVLSQMKNYWSGKKELAAIEIEINRMHDKILSRTKTLKNLEKSWQEAYFRMIEKEERMREEETILREFLQEFTELCKRKKNLMGNENDGEEKNKDSEKSKE